MDHNTTFAISAAGMSMERARVEVAALNLANAHAAHTPGGPGFSPLKVVARANMASFAAMLTSHPAATTPAFSLEASNAPARLVHEPGHPMADGRGFVAYPGVDPAAEMVSLLGATRAYEANVAAMNAARQMTLKALEIGGGS